MKKKRDCSIWVNKSFFFFFNCEVDDMVNVLVKAQLLFLLEIFSVWDHTLQMSKSE